MKGSLYLCATPIGNLSDITIRAINTLKEVDIIAAEDTRVSKKLLNHFEIKTELTSYHEFNKHEKGSYLVEKLLSGKNIALISDAGLPGVSDPGEELVKLCYENDINVTVVPGASASLSALIISGLSTRRFSFEGFLPRDKREREEILLSLENETRTIILYEAPHRLLKTLKELYEKLGDRKITIVKEITKIHEGVFITTLKDAIEHYREEAPRGEFVIVVEGRKISEIKKEREEEFRNLDINEHLNRYLERGIEKKEAMRYVAKERGISKSSVYKLLLKDRP